MKITNAMRKPDLPETLLFQPAGLLALPNSVEVSDALSVNGSGVGMASDSIKSSLGEYFERRHFYREILSKKRGFLSESLTDEESDSFKTAFVQTASKRISVREIEQHQFTLSEVVRASDFSICSIPSVCISLSSHRLEDDNFFYPLRDTCGCSFHWYADFAFLGAVKEYLERQFLLRFWLTKKCRSLISPIRAVELLVGRNSRHLYSFLIASGDISIFDISDSRFPGVCILVVYGQRKVNHHVSYCAGMSYASTIGNALEKSMLELWQTFRFIDLFKATGSNEEKVEDAYLKYFLSCNSYGTYEEISDVEIVVESQEVYSCSKFTLSGLLSILNDQGVLGYFYSRSSTVNGVGCVFSKYVSPDLFLHMNNSKNINLVNKYSREFSGEILQSRLKRMVPFP